VPARAKYNKLVAAAEVADALVRATIERRTLQETRVTQAADRARNANPKFETAQRFAAIQEELQAARAALDLSARNRAKPRADQTVAQLRQSLVALASGPVRLAGVSAAPRQNEDLNHVIIRARDELN
jgi:hypothetical protein